MENRVASELRRICIGAVEELHLCGVTITVIAADGIEASAAASGDAIQAMSELQFVLGEGPTPDCYETGRPVLVPDLAASDGRWVGFTPSATAAGVSGVYAFPLGLGAVRLGVLACYSTAGHRLEPHELKRCLIVADDVTTLLLSGSPENGTQGDPDVQRTLHIRAEVYQAQGMLRIALGVTLSEALVRLRAMAYAEGVDINALAADLVTGKRPFPTHVEDSR